MNTLADKFLQNKKIMLILVPWKTSYLLILKFKGKYSFNTNKHKFKMGLSKFWYYTIMTAVILHIVIAFGYLMYKLSTKKKDKNQNEPSKTNLEKHKNSL